MYRQLPEAWAHQPAWTVLDTDFQHGQHFRTIWLAWQRDAQRPRLLHYVAMAEALPVWLVTCDATGADRQPVGWGALSAQALELGNGFHRLLLDAGRVSLTLCLGDVQRQLAEHVFQADTIFAAPPTDKWAVQLLARRCKRGTRFYFPAKPRQNLSGPTPTVALTQWLTAQGFALDQAASEAAVQSGQFNPRWEISTSRSASRQVHQATTHCAVIGAGIAGASAAQALALRGWQVTVFDLDVAPARGASSLPVGLAVPHVSGDDNPRSRLSRSGTRLLAQHAMRLLTRDQDWAPSGVQERRSDGTTLWHADACWIKPSALVRVWLNQPGVHFKGGIQVAALECRADQWHLQDGNGNDLGEFAVVIVANAMGCVPLLKNVPIDSLKEPEFRVTMAALHGIHGTLSLGHYLEPVANLPPTPINGDGCFIPLVPGPEGAQWLAGSTFETDALLAADLPAQHAINMQRVRHLLGDAGTDIVDTLERGPHTQWSSTRCVTHDRLPLVGPVEAASHPGLWMCIGMGSRGLSFSALCAELLVARLGGEPWPIEFSLARSLDVNRVRRGT